jgi:hypothetical protein
MKHPLYGAYSEIRGRENEEKFLIDNRDKFSLGEALDFFCGTGNNFIAYSNLGVKGVIEFMKNWLNDPNPNYNNPELLERVELPRVKHSCCPRENNHTEKIQDMEGNTRCGHIEINRTRKRGIDFLFDNLSGMNRNNFKNALNGRRTVNICYAIIQESMEKYLPLETILKRVSISENRRENETVAFPFEGFTLANYVYSWSLQKGEKIFYEGDKHFVEHREFPNFVPYGDED